MRLVVESFINESVLYRGLMEERMAVEWRILRQRMVTLVMEHLEDGPCRVEVLRYTHDEPQNRRKRLEYVVLINELADVRPWIYAATTNQANLQAIGRQDPPLTIPPPEHTNDWI